MRKGNGVDLKDATRAVVRRNIRLLRERAKDYFYANDNKQYASFQTRTLQEMYRFIVKQYDLNKPQASSLSKGIQHQVQNELIASFGVTNIKSDKTKDNQIYYEIKMENADFGSVVRKRRKDNLIKQKKEKVMMSIQLDKDLHEAIKDYCETKGVTVSSLVRHHFIDVLGEDF